jgi:hypothetical protein
MTVLMSGWLSEIFSDFLSDCQAGLGLDRERLGPRDGGVAPLRLSLERTRSKKVQAPKSAMLR